MEYVKLKAAILEAEKKCGMGNLDPILRDLLHAVAYENETNRRINVSSLLRRDSYGTLPTLIKRLNILEQAGWIERVDDPDDRRYCMLLVTSNAKNAFSKISKMIDAACISRIGINK